MPDTPTPTPETPPVAPAATPAAPENLTFSKVAESMGMGWIYEAMGGDSSLESYLDKHPKDFNSALRNYLGGKETISTHEQLQNLSIIQRMGLLIYSMFTGGGEKKEKKGEGALLSEQLKEKAKTILNFANFRTYWTAKAGETAPVFPDAGPHSYWKGPALLNFVDIQAHLAEKGEEALKKWPELFPYPAGSRVMIGKDQTALQAIVDAPAAKTTFEAIGLKLVLVAPGAAPSAPADNEIQLVSVQDTDPMDLGRVKALLPYWEEGAVPTQFAECPKTVATLMALKEEGPTYSQPEELCKKVGITAPDAALVQFIEKAHDPNS